MGRNSRLVECNDFTPFQLLLKCTRHGMVQYIITVVYYYPAFTNNNACTMYIHTVCMYVLYNNAFRVLFVQPYTYILRSLHPNRTRNLSLIIDHLQ